MFQLDVLGDVKMNKIFLFILYIYKKIGAVFALRLDSESMMSLQFKDKLLQIIYSGRNFFI